MKRSKVILLGTICVLILAVSWITAITAPTDAEKQERLLAQADAFVQDEIYIRAVPLLEEAAGYSDDYTLEAEEALKNVYRHLLEQSEFAQKYIALLEKQMERPDANAECYEEAAEYYFDRSQAAKAFSVLRSGVSKTESKELEAFYESERYQFRLHNECYDDVTLTCNGAIQVKKGNLWGLADATGELVVPCEYNKVSTYSSGEAIAKKGNIVSGIDGDNNRVALSHEKITDFRNYNENRVALKMKDGWMISDGNFNTGSISFEDLATFSDGGAAAKSNGKWGVVNTSGGEWLIPAEYDTVIQDELGRAYKNETVFVKQGSKVNLLVKGKVVGETYEDAYPFADGWAAVKKHGKWGFIDETGDTQIDFKFDDARSFGQHLAAVELDGKWGYISKYGEMVIPNVYLDARNFYYGSAPVKTETGWRFITLVEYEDGGDL